MAFTDPIRPRTSARAPRVRARTTAQKPRPYFSGKAILFSGQAEMWWSAKRRWISGGSTSNQPGKTPKKNVTSTPVPVMILSIDECLARGEVKKSPPVRDTARRIPSKTFRRSARILAFALLFLLNVLLVVFEAPWYEELAISRDERPRSGRTRGPGGRSLRPPRLMERRLTGRLPRSRSFTTSSQHGQRTRNA